MKKTLSIAVLLCVIGINAMAQDSQSKIKGIQASQFIATELRNDSKLFAVPLVAELDLVKGAQTTFTTTYTYLIPTAPTFPKKASKAQIESIRKAYVENVQSGIENAFTEVKAKALFEFSEHAKADVIVSPLFSITTEESDATKVVFKVKVKGYPARYTNFRSLRDSDSTLIKLNNRIHTNIIEDIPIGGTPTDTDNKETITKTKIK